MIWLTPSEENIVEITLFTVGKVAKLYDTTI